LLIARLERFPRALAAVLEGLSPEDATWHPSGGGWSIAEVVGHLVLEETDDFRVRLASVLENPAKPWPKFDPEGAVKAGGFDAHGIRELVAEFTARRAASVAWLRSLPTMDADATYVHPRGNLRAGDLLASWAAHDARHLEQIAKRLHGIVKRDGAPYDVGYAG
jgi:hypothetical protein